MGPRQTYPTRNYAIGQYLLTLRSRSKLTQAELASQVGVHRRSVQKWESGETYPTAENLRALIAVLLTLDVFSQGREQDEATTLWQQVSEAAPQPLPLFDIAWFNGLLAVRTGVEPVPISRASAPLIDYPAAPAVERQRSQSNRLFTLPLIGRASELAEIAGLLGNPACRLLTLLGPGGIGKTRLALAATAAQTGRFSDGVTFVSLPAASDPHKAIPNPLVSTISEALNLPFDRQADPSGHLLNYLRGRQMLLALDGFEGLLAEPHTREGAGLVYDILKHAPSVTLLVTSRVRLNLQAEWLFEVEGLSYPSGQNAASSLAALGTPTEAGPVYGAVELFVQRARQVQPGFPLSEATLATIVRICQQVAGMPLAIELAAAGVRLLPVTEIERQIRSNLDAFATTLRDVPERHRSLRAVFDQSWNLLNEAEQVLFSRLAIFRGGCSVAAAEQVAGATLPALVALVDKSLVRQTEVETRLSAGANPATGRRFTLLEPIREYALEKLAGRGEIETLQRAHASYYLSLAETAEAQPVGLAPALSIEQLDREYDNMRTALQWAGDGGDLTLGLRLASALQWFWRRRGYISEGRLWLEALLALADDNPEPKAMAARLRALEGAAWLAFHQHDYTRAAQLFEQGTMLRWALGEPEGETNLLTNGALEARAIGNYGRATTLLEDAVARGRALGDQGSLSRAGLGLWLFLLGLVSREQGDFKRAATLFEEAVALHRNLGDREGLAIGLLALSDIARDQGDIARLRTIAEESLVLLRELEVQWAIGFALNNLALGAYMAGDLPQALAFSTESIALFRTQKAEGSLAEVLVTLGQLLQAQGEKALAYQALTEALQLAWTVGPRLMGAAALESLASLIFSPGAARLPTGPMVASPPGGASHTAAGNEGARNIPQEEAALATRLLASAAALRSQMGTPVRPIDQAALARTLAALKAALGPDAFATLWQTAKMLTLEQVLEALPDPAVFAASITQAERIGEAGGPATASFKAQPVAGSPSDLSLSPAARPRVDWGLAQDVPALYGRTGELAILSSWALAEGSRVITLVGMGGIGKTSLALTLARQVAPHFEVVIFRSMGEAPPLPELLDQLIQRVSPQQLTSPPQLSEKLALLIKLLQQSRCLLILDNLETLMQTGTTAGHYLAGYEGYGMLFKSLGETAHQSCLVLTTRERPPELAPLEGPRTAVRSLQLTGLPEEACQTLLADQALTSTPGDAAALARRYGGNPLALKLVAEPIRALFSGDIASFLTEGVLFFEGVGQLLAQQIGRASALEQALLTWLAIMREPVGLDGLMQNLARAAPAPPLEGGRPISRSTILAALHALWRRNLIERGQENLTFTLQRVVLEYLTQRLVEQAANEIRQSRFEVLRRHALLQATAREYVRRSQERMIVEPLLAQLGDSLTMKQAVEAQLREALENVRRLPQVEQGYSAGNILNLLVQLGCDLRGYDFSHQNIWQANLADIELPEVNFRGADFAGSHFTEAFKTIVPVSFSPDGRYLAAGSIDGEIWLWQVADNQQVGLFQGHTGPVNSLAFSPDSHSLASGSSDGSIMLWELASGARLATLSGHSSRVWAVAFSPDGACLATGSDDQTIKLWSASSGVCLATLAGHEAPVASVAFSPDGSRLASGSHDPKPAIKFWDIASGLCTTTLLGHTADIWAVAFSPDGTLLASGSADLTLRLWSATTGAQSGILLGHTARIRSLAWSPDGTTLASGSLDQTVKLWDIAALPVPSPSTGSPSGDGQAAIIADTTSDLCRATLAENTGPVNGVAFSPEGDTLAGGGELQMIALWSVARQECLALLYGYNSGILSLAFSPDGATLASAGFDRIIRLWSSVQHTRLARLSGHTGAIYSLAFSPDGKLLASGSGGDDHTLRLWSVASLTCLSSRLEHRGPVVSVAWSADGRTLASGSLDRTIKLWSPTSPSSLASLEGHSDAVRALAFSPDSTLLASAGYDRTVRLWSVTRREPLQTFSGHTAPVRAVTFSPDGRLIASGSADRTIRLWGVASGECLAILKGHSGEVVSVAFSGDGATLASGSFDGTIRLWEVSRALDGEGGDLATLDPEAGVIYALAFSPDDRTLASGSAEGSMTLWDLPTRQSVATMRGRGPYTGMDITAATGLTEAQRATLRGLGAVES